MLCSQEMVRDRSIALALSWIVPSGVANAVKERTFELPFWGQGCGGVVVDLRFRRM